MTEAEALVKIAENTYHLWVIMVVISCLIGVFLGIYAADKIVKG